MKKSLVASFLSLTMILGMLSGCGQPAATASGPAPAAEEATAEEAPAAEETAEAADAN